MRKRHSAVLALVLAAACGGGDGDDGDPGLCEPPPPQLPTGMYTDPYALELPATCVAGGLRDLPGRWFVRRPDGGFNYSYPRYEGDCATGFNRAFFPEDHDDTEDGYSYYQWSDGTRLFERTYYRFAFEDPPLEYEYIRAQVRCMLPDDTLAVTQVYYDTDLGETTYTAAGTRFAPLGEPAAGLALVGSIDGGGTIRAYNVVVDGAYAYVVGPNGFDVIDVSAPELPVQRGHVDGAFNDVKVARGNGGIVAYLSPINEDDTWVVDVTAADAPVVLSTIPQYSHSVFLQGTNLYLATYTNSVPVYDVSEPTAPTMIGVATDPGPEAGIHDLFADGDMIYINNTTEGFVALDVSGGLASPAVERGRFRSNEYSHASWVGTVGGRRIALHGDEGMGPTGGALLRVLDGDPASPTYLTEIGRYASRPEVGIHNFVVAGDRAYIAYYQDGVRVVDLSDPTRPAEIAHYNTWDDATALGGAFEGALGIRVVDDRIYVADSDRGLLILEHP